MVTILVVTLRSGFIYHRVDLADIESASKVKSSQSTTCVVGFNCLRVPDILRRSSRLTNTLGLHTVRWHIRVSHISTIWLWTTGVYHQNPENRSWLCQDEFIFAGENQYTGSVNERSRFLCICVLISWSRKSNLSRHAL